MVCGSDTGISEGWSNREIPRERRRQGGLWRFREQVFTSVISNITEVEARNIEITVKAKAPRVGVLPEVN